MDGVADTPRGALAVRLDGPSEAPPLLLINALGTTLELWDAHVRVLSSRFRVIRYDVSGHGRSRAAAPVGSLDDLGQDACAVLDAAGAPAAHVAGVSLGGLTALWLAVHAPERVRRVVLANTAARVGTVERWDERVAVVRRDGLEPVAARTIGTWFTDAFVAASPEVAERCRRMVTGCSPEGYCGCCLALRDADLRGALHRIGSPALVVAGADDVSTPVADAEALVAGIPGSRLLVLPGAHLSSVECAEAFTGHVGDFLADG